MREVRLKFSKTDRCKYISHLDINRCMSRALTRAQIPLWYTEGFNPHPYMCFSLPLPLGVESLNESMDIRITGDISNEEIKSKMNNVLPTGIRILDVYDDFRPDKDIAYADYVIKIQFKDNKNAFEKIASVLNGDEITAVKKAKKGKRKVFKEVNIKPLVYSSNASIRNDEIVLNLRLCAGIEKNLNPCLLFDTIMKLIDMDYEWKSISKISLLDKDFKEFK